MQTTQEAKDRSAGVPAGSFDDGGGRQRQAAGNGPASEQMTASAVSKAVTPGSLADQYNTQSDGRDPASFFYGG